MFKALNKAEVEFELIEEIGQDGTNSKVFKAYDKQLDAQIVLKIIDIKHLTNPDEYYEESRRLYLSTHKNVVEVKYACKDISNIFIAMPYYKKGSIKKLIDNKFLTVREIIKYSLDIISGLHNIHSKKLIHFDVKPDNILLSDSNDALISDFGLAKPTNLSGIAGQDRQYIKHKPPEAFEYDHFDLRYDIYQFGLTLYRMCNGNKNFNDQFRTYLDASETIDISKYKFDCKNGRFPDRNKYLYHIPQKLRRIIKKCLESNPDKRYSSIIDIANDLSEIDGNLLDWQYDRIGDAEVLQKQFDDKVIKVTIDENKESTSLKEFKTGQIQRITAFCKKDITESEIKNFLERY